MGSQTNITARTASLDANVRRVFDALRWIVRDLRLAQHPGGPRTGLSAAQVFVLHTLKEHGPLSIGDLAERTATDPSSVSVVVTKLCDKGLVCKNASAQDRRRLEVSLTAPGSRKAGQASVPPFQQELLERLAQLQPEELATLAELLTRVAPPARDAEPAPMFFQEDAP